MPTKVVFWDVSVYIHHPNMFLLASKNAFFEKWREIYFVEYRSLITLQYYTQKDNLSLVTQQEKSKISLLNYDATWGCFGTIFSYFFIMGLNGQNVIGPQIPKSKIIGF